MKRQAVCAVCGREFTADRVTQKYCSSYCRRYAHRHGANNHVRSSRKKEALRTFRCLKCGKLVRVTEPKDKRTTFCSQACREKWFSLNRNKNTLHIKGNPVRRRSIV